MGFFSDLFGGGEKETKQETRQDTTKDYSYDFLRSPEFAETAGARGSWFDKLTQWGQQPGYGAIAPNWGDIWDTAQKRIKQYYWGGPGGQPGLSDKVKASAARRGVSDSPALETELTHMGYEEAGKQGELATGMAREEAAFGEQGRQNWLQSLMQMAGLQVPGQWAQSGVTGTNIGTSTGTTTKTEDQGSPFAKLLGGLVGPGLSGLFGGGEGGGSDWLSKLLPMAGTAIGSMFGGPVGGAIGGSIGGMAGEGIMSGRDTDYGKAALDWPDYKL